MNAEYTVTNIPDAMQANVFANTRRAGFFNVCLKDLDSGEIVPTSYIVEGLDAAKAKADWMVGK